MKRALIAALAVIGSLLVAAGPATAADYDYCRDADMKSPTVSSVALSPTAMVIGSGARKSFTMTVKASDDCAIDHLYVQMWPQGVDTFLGIFLTNWTLVGGTTSNGTWRSTYTLDQQQPGGLYQIRWVEATDTRFNTTPLTPWAQPTMQVWHQTTTSLKKPKSEVKKKVALAGQLKVYGGFGTWNVQIQKRLPGKKKWTKVKDVRTNAWGDFGTLVDVKSTSYFRAIHYRDANSVGSASGSYKVKVKK